MRKLLAFVSIAGAALVGAAAPAHAACHAFDVSAAPATVAEGGSVTVTVSRDGAVQPSEVRLRTVDDSAKAGDDFGGLDQVVKFTNELSRNIVIGVTDDPTMEGAETFRVELVKDSGAGCPVNTQYRYGDPVTVTIQANDAQVAPPPTTSTTKPPTTTTSPGVTVGTAPTSSTSSTSTTSTTALVADLDDEERAVDDDDSGDSTALLLFLGLIAATGGVAVLLYLRRRGSI